MKRPVAAALVAGGILAASVSTADAATFLVNYETTYTYSATSDTAPPPSDCPPNCFPVDVFGVSQETLVSFSFTIDTNAPGAVFMPKTAGGGWEKDLYGFDMAALSDFSVTFGTETFTKDDIGIRIPEGGYEADVWFDAPLTDGASPNTWMVLYNGSGGGIAFGLGTGGNPDYLASRSAVFEQIDPFNSRWALSNQMNVSVSAIPAPVPIPAALPLLLSALGFFGFMGWRRKRTAAA